MPKWDRAKPKGNRVTKTHNCMPTNSEACASQGAICPCLTAIPHKPSTESHCKTWASGPGSIEFICIPMRGSLRA